jgi:glucosamine kinase
MISKIPLSEGRAALMNLISMPQLTKLIADSGSTKTDWRIIYPDGQIKQTRTSGINPYFQSKEEISLALQNELMPVLDTVMNEVHYYGAGCSAPDKVALVTEVLSEAFPEAGITVNGDMLAAARSLCGHEKGIACILGTGSNSCFFDGQQISQQIPNLGFWLGDEGSGGHLGKLLLQAYLHKELPEALHAKFSKRYNEPTRNEIIENLYNKPFPNRYAASFAKFLFDNRTDAFAYKMVYKAFDEFFARYVVKYEGHLNVPVHFVGSIAFYHSNILRQVALDRNIMVKNILESPIAGLTLYHQDMPGHEA